MFILWSSGGGLLINIIFVGLTKNGRQNWVVSTGGRHNLVPGLTTECRPPAWSAIYCTPILNYNLCFYYFVFCIIIFARFIFLLICKSCRKEWFLNPTPWSVDFYLISNKMRLIKLNDNCCMHYSNMRKYVP